MLAAVTGVEPECEFVHVAGQVFSTRVVIDPMQTALEHGKHAFNTVCRNPIPRVFVRAVVDRFVLEKQAVYVGIDSGLVAVDRRSDLSPAVQLEDGHGRPGLHQLSRIAGVHVESGRADGPGLEAQRPLMGQHHVQAWPELLPGPPDRIGNLAELEPYLDLWRSIPCEQGVLEIVAIEHDATSTEVPRIPKGTSGRALG